MAMSEAEYIKWDMEDQGLGPEYPTPDDKPLDETDDDDVFLLRDEARLTEGGATAAPKPKIYKIEKKRPLSRSPPCPAQWSVSHRCLDCVWKERRGGRPHHPPPPISPPGMTASSPLVTLQSLGTTRDSGYEPSPTSAFSFSFDDDEEDTELDEAGSGNPLGVEDPRAATGVTPPINIPSSGGAVGNSGRRNRSRILKVASPCSPPPIELIQGDTPRRETRDVLPPPPTPLRRTKSEPDLWASERVLPRTPIIIRSGGNFLNMPMLASCHGRNYSLPATTPDGRPLFAPTPPTPASRSSRERLIDLAEVDPEGSHGHHRRVLVLALPDLLVDLETLKREESSLSSSSSLQSPSVKSYCSSSSSNDAFSSPSTNSSKFTPVRRCGLLGMTTSSVSTPSNASSDTSDTCPRPARPRPTWRRPRALSCDVTLELEFGQELRKAADDFTRMYSARARGIWRSLRNGFGRRLSTEGCAQSRVNPSEGPPEERGSHSLPAHPSSTLYQ